MKTNRPILTSPQSPGDIVMLTAPPPGSAPRTPSEQETARPALGRGRQIVSGDDIETE